MTVKLVFDYFDQFKVRNNYLFFYSFAFWLKKKPQVGQKCKLQEKVDHQIAFLFVLSNLKVWVFWKTGLKKHKLIVLLHLFTFLAWYVRNFKVLSKEGFSPIRPSILCPTDSARAYYRPASPHGETGSCSARHSSRLPSRQLQFDRNKTCSKTDFGYLWRLK